MNEPGGRTTLGVLLLNFGLLLFVVHDALGKVLTARYPIFEIIFLRSVFALPFVLLFLRWEHGSIQLRTGRFWALTARGLLGVASFSLFLMGLKIMPLADTFAIFNSAPLLVAALAGPLLGEPATRRQWIAVLVGFAAVLFMIRPGGAIPLMGAAIMVVSVSCFSLGIILTRSLGRTESASMMTVFAMAIFVIAGGVGIPFAWTTPTLGDLGLMTILGVLAASAMYCTFFAYKHGAPARMVPFQYVTLVWAVLIGYVIWRDVPDLSVIAGGVVVVGSGLFVLRSGK